MMSRASLIIITILSMFLYSRTQKCLYVCRVEFQLNNCTRIQCHILSVCVIGNATHAAYVFLCLFKIRHWDIVSYIAV